MSSCFTFKLFDFRFSHRRVSGQLGHHLLSFEDYFDEKRPKDAYLEAYLDTYVNNTMTYQLGCFMHRAHRKHCPPEVRILLPAACGLLSAVCCLLSASCYLLFAIFSLVMITSSSLYYLRSSTEPIDPGGIRASEAVGGEHDICGLLRELHV
jgi:hypothetical protein